MIFSIMMAYGLKRYNIKLLLFIIYFLRFFVLFLLCTYSKREGK